MGEQQLPISLCEMQLYVRTLDKYFWRKDYDA